MRKTATEVRMETGRLAKMLPLLREKGFELHPPFADLALQEGDTYSFTFGRERILCLYDGADWRFVTAMPCGSEDDFDTSVVTVL